jgi:DNA polymerase-3 subunit gamma/tau
MGQALYRKYRSKSLKDVAGQDHITSTLEQALQQGRISHAYLFTGPRGVGKTSVARILAHEINELPYTDDTPHIDIIEIDAASNRRIDEIRELREKVYVAPTSAKYKVYIIDEVHMLTREAFNALLKTLEEPPAHVVFILATTDAHKLPETIISRTQRFSFKPADKNTTVEHLRSVAKQEKIKVDDAALELLAEHGGGSFRDSMSLLDQASSHGQAVTEESVRQLLGLPSAGALGQLWQTVAGGAEPAVLIGLLENLYAQGYQAAAIAKQLQETIRGELLENSVSMDYEKALALSTQLLNVPAAHDPERYLEITLLGSLPAPQTPPAVVEKSIQEEKKTAKEPQPEPNTEPKAHKETPKKAPVTHVGALQAPPKGGAVLDTTLWPRVLQALKQKHNTLYGVVRMAQPTFDEDTVTLAFAFAFHQKRLNEANNRQKLADIIQSLTGQSVNIECVVDKGAQPPTVETPVAPPQPSSGDISAISNIFNGAELLES